MSPGETYRLHDWFHIYLSKTTPIIQTSSLSLSITYLMKSREDTANDTAAGVNKDGINNNNNNSNNDYHNY
jgi:hypothetical protein